MSIFNALNSLRENVNAGYFVLIDPDAHEYDNLSKMIKQVTDAGADAILVGGSLMMTDHYDQKVQIIKESTALPVILFPGSISQVNAHFDALLFLSLVSGRNPNYLFGDHVLVAPKIKAMGIETISTAYMLIESGKVSTTEFVSNTKPIPANKSDIAVAHAIAAEMMGFKMLYLEAGSGAKSPIPNALISAVKKAVSIPIIVGGGITHPDIAKEKVAAGADFIVTGNILEKKENLHLAKKFAHAIHNGN